MTITDTRRLSWDGLQDAWRQADDAGDAAAVIAAMERREAADQRKARARNAARAGNAEWEDAAYAQYLAACDYCKGDHNMLSDAGRKTGREAWPMLWQGSREQTDRLASDELITYWDYVSPRVASPGEIRASRAAAKRAAMAAESPAPVAAVPAYPQTRHVAATTGPQPGAMARYIARLDELTRAANRAALALGRIAP